MYYTDRQLEILDFLQDYRSRRRVSPTLDEIAENFGVSKVTIHEHVRELERKGALRRTPHRARSLEIIDEEFLGTPSSSTDSTTSEPSLPMLGRIAAGAPIDAIENSERLTLSELVPCEDGHFALEVHGDSMVEDGIHDGDVAICKSQSSAEEGETVVAIVNDEATLKHLHRLPKGQVRLQPANSSMKPIVVDEVEIRGVLVGVVRRLR